MNMNITPFMDRLQSLNSASFLCISFT